VRCLIDYFKNKFPTLYTLVQGRRLSLIRFIATKRPVSV